MQVSTSSRTLDLSCVSQRCASHLHYRHSLTHSHPLPSPLPAYAQARLPIVRSDLSFLVPPYLVYWNNATQLTVSHFNWPLKGFFPQ